MELKLGPKTWSSNSVQVEIDFDGHFDFDGMAVFLAGFEAPGFDRLERLFVEAHAQGVHDAEIRGLAVGIDDEHQSARALVLGFAGFFGKFRIGRIDGARWSDSAAGTENAAAHTTAIAGAYAWAVAGADATAAA